MFMSSVDSELRSKFPLEWTGEALHIAVEIKGKKTLWMWTDSRMPNHSTGLSEDSAKAVLSPICGLT